MKLKKILPSLTAAAAVVLAMALFLLSPARYTSSVFEGISLWALSVLPATFPFLFLTALFTRFRLFGKLSRALSPIAGKLFRVSGEGGCAAVLSMLSGYPVGARTVCDLSASGRIPAEETFRLACLCSTTGPMFLVGVVGSAMFSNPLLGWIMLLSHYLGVLVVCFFLRFTAKPPRTTALSRPAESGNALYESLYSSVISILCVGGSIAVFYAFGQMLTDLFALAGVGGTAEGILRGLLEMTSGCAYFSKQGGALACAVCCFFVTFGGFCVLVQQIAFLAKTPVKILPFLAVKFVQGLLSAAVCYPLCLLFGV